MLTAFLVFIALLISSAPAIAQLEYNTVSEGADKLLMMRGKDPVSYFQGAEPVIGNPGIKAEHGGVTYRFASEENRKLFLANPEKYVPMYGGHCSNGMAYAIGGSYGQNPPNLHGKLYPLRAVETRAL